MGVSKGSLVGGIGGAVGAGFDGDVVRDQKISGVKQQGSSFSSCNYAVITA